MAWRKAALTRITTDFSDPILARVEHYLLRYAFGSYGLFNYSIEQSKRDEKYHPIRRVACILGACKYDPSLPTWEVKGFIHGFQQYVLNRKKNISNKIESETKREVRAIKFMLWVTKLTLVLVNKLKKGMIMRRNFEVVYVLLKLDLAKRKAEYTHYEGSPMR
ncbi:MAG: hypothetical protein QNJ65_11010 [Xenococcaceae cyanobacterium MO_234.B1]|nr:hypothetical protein [Xenococcaceae cyanobacterium MO_234.B1]